MVFAVCMFFMRDDHSFYENHTFFKNRIKYMKTVSAYYSLAVAVVFISLLYLLRYDVSFYSGFGCVGIRCILSL